MQLALIQLIYLQNHVNKRLKLQNLLQKELKSDFHSVINNNNTDNLYHGTNSSVGFLLA